MKRTGLADGRLSASIRSIPRPAGSFLRAVSRMMSAKCTIAVIAISGICLLLNSSTRAHDIVAEASMEQNRIDEMLAALNKVVRERRAQARRYNIDCTDLIPQYLGASDNVAYYIDMFAAYRLSPVKVRVHHDNYIYFEIPYSRLKADHRSSFKWGDYLVVSFITESLDNNSRVIRYLATLLNELE